MFSLSNQYPTNIQQGSGLCNQCPKNQSLNAGKEFVERISTLGGKVVGKYTLSYVPVDCLCPKGHACKVLPSTLSRCRGMCKICVGYNSESGKVKFNETINKSGIKLLGEYKNHRIPVECVCSGGHTFSIKPKDVKRKYVCKICFISRMDYMKKEFFDAVSKNGGRIIGDYHNHNNAVQCICPLGHKYKYIPRNTRKTKGLCSICSLNSLQDGKKKFTEKVIESKGRIVGKYVGYEIPVECICIYGHKCYPTLKNINQGRRLCSSCVPKYKESVGAAHIRKYLTENKIEFQTEIPLKGVNKIIRRYDFVFTHGGKGYIIEFDGQQHFTYTKYWHRNVDRFNNYRLSDISKTFHALNGGHSFIRIQNNNYDSIKQFLNVALFSDKNSPNKLYVDNVEKYSYLLNTPVDANDMMKCYGRLLLKNISLYNYLNM